jgi:hypothetical protein
VNLASGAAQRLNKPSKSATRASYAFTDHRKDIEKTFPGKRCLDRRWILGIVPLSGAGVIIGRTFEFEFSLMI